MPIQKADIQEFLRFSIDIPILDVRSPSEYNHAHIPGAVSIPLFTDEQRAEIGTAYTQVNRELAVDIGLKYFSGRMKTIPAEIKNKLPNQFSSDKNNTPSFLIHCWRGGMRSEAVAWLLSLYGYKIFVLSGGYKAFRRWALLQFEKKYLLKIIGGFTGSGKTSVLKELQGRGKKVIDLEALANHKGSAFGALGENSQPSHEMFENLLVLELWKLSQNRNGNENLKHSVDEIWLEDESNHIGSVGIPKIFWEQMRKSPLFFLDIPFEERLDYILKNYGAFSPAQLIECTLKIQKRLGGLNTKLVIQHFSENNYRAAFSVLLKYYDSMYSKSLDNRENVESLLNKVICNTVNASNSELLISVNCC